jgi:hypothetical protein
MNGSSLKEPSRTDDRKYLSLVPVHGEHLAALYQAALEDGDRARDGWSLGYSAWRATRLYELHAYLSAENSDPHTEGRETEMSVDDQFLSAFERKMRRIDGRMPDVWRRAIVDVVDMAETAKFWFDSMGVKPTAADIVALTNLMLERELEIRSTQECVRGRYPTQAPAA